MNGSRLVQPTTTRADGCAASCARAWLTGIRRRDALGPGRAYGGRTDASGGRWGYTMIVMPARAGRWALAATALAAVALSGCSPSEQAREDAGAPTATSSKAPNSSAPTTETLSPAEREALDRAAAEQAWLDYWDQRDSLAANYSDVPESEWYPLMSQYAVEEIARQDTVGFADLRSRGWVAYGQVEHRVFWEEDIAGGDTARLWDCRDDSQAGAMDIATGEKRTVGEAGKGYRGTLIRGDDGQWRVQLLEYDPAREC